MNQETIDKIRNFNRFYTKILGVLNKRYMGSNFGLPLIRVIQDVYLHPGRGAKEISEELNIDKGYMSRIVKQLENGGYISRKSSENDGRREIISLSDSGLKVYHNLNRAANESVRQIYSGIPDERISEMISHMDAIERIINRRQK